MSRSAVQEHATTKLDERRAKGADWRRQVPLTAQAEWKPPANRADPVEILVEQGKSRIQELLPVRYARMKRDAFAFLRGAAAVMASDLAHQPTAGASVQGCGDCHLMNFGAFATPEDNILFDINDFDETLPGVDFTVDLKRLVASVAVAAKAANLSNKRARNLSASAAAAYREHMFDLMKLSPLEVWHRRIDLEQVLKLVENPELRSNLSALIARARASGLEKDDNFPHLVTGAQPKIADKPPTIFHFGRKADPRHKIDAGRAFDLYRASLSPDRTGLLERHQLRDIAF